MVGVVERDEALGMHGGPEDHGRVLDADGFVAGRVEDHQRLLQRGDPTGQPRPGKIVEELLADREAAPREDHLRLAVGLDSREVGGEILHHMRRVGGRADGRHGARLGDLAGRRQHGGATERMADQQLRRVAGRAQMRRGGDQIGDVRGEVGVGEFALAPAQTGEIEAQHRDAARRERAGDALGREDDPWSR